MANSLSEGFVRLTYTGLTTVHHMIIPVNFAGSPVIGEMPDLTTKDGSTLTVEAGIADYVDVLRTAFSDETTFGLAEAYTVSPIDDFRQFIWAWDVNVAGNNAGGNVALAMMTITFKTAAGGVLRVVLMESVFTVNQKLFPPFTAIAPLDAISDYVISNDSIVIGRDNFYAFAPISATTKTSDALRKAAGL